MKQSGFQQMMRLWEQVHPVNAVQCVELSASFEFGRLQAAVQRSLQKLETTFSGGDWRLHFGGSDLTGADIVETSVPCLCNGHAVEEFITRLMNHRFLDTQLPVRVGYFLRAKIHVIWICYRHVIADARSIARLLQHHCRLGMTSPSPCKREKPQLKHLTPLWLVLSCMPWSALDPTLLMPWPCSQSTPQNQPTVTGKQGRVYFGTFKALKICASPLEAPCQKCCKA